MITRCIATRSERGYVSFANRSDAGIRFVDILVPLVFLVLHTVVDQVLDWRRDALRFARAKEGR
jgi:hypothetical protein